MNKLTIILIVMGFCIQNSNLWALEARITMLKNKKSKKKSSTKKRGSGELFKRLMQNNQKINDLLKARTQIPVIWEGNQRVLTGKTYRGTLLNSINSTNIASPVLVQADLNQGLPFNSKFSCQAITQQKRVYCICNKLITTTKEIPISAQLLNLDGSSGLAGIYEDGKEDLITGMILSEFSQGVLASAQDKITTPFGNIQEHGLKNHLLQGGVKSASGASKILSEEMKQTVPVVTIKAGAKVLIYFMEKIHEL